MTPDVIINPSVLVVPNATIYDFGVLQSTMHNAWMRSVGGRMKSDYQYSASIVYNNFPWPEIPVFCRGEANGSPASPLTEVQSKADKAGESCFAPTTSKAQTAIETAAQKVLDTRANYPSATLADLYDPLTMPPDLVKAHQTLDKAVDAAYGKVGFKTEAERVAFLFERYQQLTAPLVTTQKSEKKKKRGV
jgi:hypothetical protein